MMVLQYCENENLRNYYLNNHRDGTMKIYDLFRIANGLLIIHNAGKVHKDFHSGNTLYGSNMHISDLGMCQPANNEEPSVKKGVYGVYLIWHQKFYMDINVQKQQMFLI